MVATHKQLLPSQDTPLTRADILSPPPPGSEHPTCAAMFHRELFSHATERADPENPHRTEVPACCWAVRRSRLMRMFLADPPAFHPKGSQPMVEFGCLFLLLLGCFRGEGISSLVPGSIGHLLL